MKKTILKLGDALSRREQQSIHGGLDVGLFDELGECSTTCKDGSTVKCKGSNCSATENLGCSAGEGTNKDEKSCPGTDLDFLF